MTRRDAAPKRPVVVLCGFMGTGKTVVGRALARLLDVELIDTDAVIAEREGMNVAAVFDERGESHFRALEAHLCRSLDPKRGAVIATGGGMVMDRRNFDRLQSLGTTVWLDASVDAIVARTEEAGGRPLLAKGRATPEASARRSVESLLAERTPVYRQCELHVDTTHRSPEETAFDIRETMEYSASGHDASRALVPMRVDTRPLPGRRPHAGNSRLSRIVVGRGASSELGAWLERLELATPVFFLSPRHIADVALPCITPSLDERSVPWRTVDVDDGDANKTLDQASRLLDALAAAGAARDSVVVALGGGVTGDVAGFVASVYMRGVPFVQIPTTLLAQVDASIGGKVGVNHPRAKNLIGAIHQPHLVLTDPDFLDTLSNRELANGMAEAVKASIIGAPDLFERLAERAGAGRPSPRELDEVVAACVRVKAHIVERDPYERDERRVLNLGHTLGHALESALAYSGLSHGEAVALGLLAAWRVAASRGVAERAWLDRTRDVLQRCGLPTQPPRVDDGALRSALGLDKKRRAGKLSFVLPIRPGRVEIVDDVTEDELIAATRE